MGTVRTPAQSYAYYLWNHIDAVAWWATNLTTINNDTRSFIRADGLSGMHFFTRSDLLVGAQRAAQLALERPLAPAVPPLPRSPLLNVLSGNWDKAPTTRGFINLALQLAVFESAEFAAQPDSPACLMSA